MSVHTLLSLKQSKKYEIRKEAKDDQGGVNRGY
jgi:hypothetical protein